MHFSQLAIELFMVGKEPIALIQRVLWPFTNPSLLGVMHIDHNPILSNCFSFNRSNIY